MVHNLLGGAVSIIINDVVEYSYFFPRSIRFHWRLSIDARWVMCLYKWLWKLHSCGWSLYEWHTTHKWKPGLGLLSMWT